MSNMWAERKSFDKRVSRETFVSEKNAKQLEHEANRMGHKSSVKRDTERASTAARRERKALYGKYDPMSAVSLCCHMLVINGVCSGCGE